MEILGGNLKSFFNKMNNQQNEAENTYFGDKFEVWDVSENLYNKMYGMTEDEFLKLAGEDAWWRNCEGSVLQYLKRGTIDINGKEMIGWIEMYGKNIIHYDLSYCSLTEYLCEFIGASTGKNVCACAKDLAKYNNMTMGELFNEYEM